MTALFNPEEFGKRVAQELVKRGKTLRQASEEICISRNSLHRITQGKTPELETYLRINKWMES